MSESSFFEQEYHILRYVRSPSSPFHFWLRTDGRCQTSKWGAGWWNEAGDRAVVDGKRLKKMANLLTAVTEVFCRNQQSFKNEPKWNKQRSFILYFVPLIELFKTGFFYAPKWRGSAKGTKGLAARAPFSDYSHAGSWSHCGYQLQVQQERSNIAADF